MLTPSLLDELQSLLRERGARVADSWRPPASAELVAEKVGALGLTVPAEVSVWWGWHDGVAGDSLQMRLIGLGWEPLQLDDAVEATLTHRRLAETEDPFPDWPQPWLVLGFDGSRGRLVCDTSVEPGEPSPIYVYFDDEPPAGPILPSLGEVVSFWIKAIRDDVLKVDDDGAFAYMSPEQLTSAAGPLANLL
jgi:hypothetical protein